MTLLLCLNVDWLGVWENRTAEAFTVIGGWSLSPDQLLIGSTRLLYPFFAGLLLSRANRLIKVRGGFWLCSALIAAVLVMPRVVAPCMPFHSCRCLAIRADVSEKLLHGKGMCAFAPLPHIAPRLTSVP